MKQIILLLNIKLKEMMKKLLLLLALTWFPAAGFAQEAASGTTGDGATEQDYDYFSAPWSSYRDNIKTVILEQGVTGIRRNAFSGCSGLTSVTIPNMEITF
jgi:hypothetical protein